MTRPRRPLPPPTDPILTLNAGSSSFKFAVFEQTASGAPRTRLPGEVTGLQAVPRIVTRDAAGGSSPTSAGRMVRPPASARRRLMGVSVTTGLESMQPSRVRWRTMLHPARRLVMSRVWNRRC